jgi:H+-transporting ATPase
LIGTILTLVGIPDLVALPWWQPLAVFGYAMVACLGVNDALKVGMIKWRVPESVAGKHMDLTPQIAKRAYELYEQRGRGDGQDVQDWSKAQQELQNQKPHKG